MKDPVALNQGQVGSQNELCRREPLPGIVAAPVVEQPSQNGARFGVQVQRSPRSSSSRRRAVPGGKGEGREGYRSERLGAPSRTFPTRARRSNSGYAAVWKALEGWRSSATGSPRSVTRIASPRRTMRRYSLRRFFSSRTPTETMVKNVASHSYIVNARKTRFSPGLCAVSPHVASAPNVSKEGAASAPSPTRASSSRRRAVPGRPADAGRIAAAPERCGFTAPSL